MIRQSAFILAALFLSSCDGWNPLVNTDPDDEELVLPPGTDNPTASGAIERYEAYDADTGNGFAEAIRWNGTRFIVDNLAFDGNNRYDRDNVVATLGIAEMYEGDLIYLDDVTGIPIWQFEHKAAAAESTSGRTRFAVVRTGSYIDYGFGGFKYERDDGVEIPTQGQAGFRGDYSAIRDFDGRSGLEYVTGDVDAAVDFRDFNDGDAVRIHIFNRQFFDTDGNDITAAIAASYPDGDIPWINPVVGPGMINDDGEIAVPVFTTYTEAGAEVEHEEGMFWGLLSGAGANMELVGISVIEGPDLRADGVDVRETGGIIAYR